MNNVAMKAVLIGDPEVVFLDPTDSISRGIAQEAAVEVAARLSIEPGIRPVCDALNSLAGVKTVYSCEGHPWRDAPPFVMFDALPEVAFRLHKLLGHGHGDGSLKYIWWLTSRFTDEGAIRFVLEPNDYRLVPQSRLIPRWRRGSMNAELQRLAALVLSPQFAIELSIEALRRGEPVRLSDTVYDISQARYHSRRDDGAFVSIYLDGMADAGDSERMLAELTAEAARLRAAGHTVL